MNGSISSLIDRLAAAHRLEHGEYKALIDGRAPEAAERLAALASEARKRIYGNKIYIRGLIEISSICKNDCLYCGLRRSNRSCQRYRLDADKILSCCREGYALGFRTFVLQGGEDAYFTDGRLCGLLRAIKREHPDCAVTLSFGERSRESYERLREAGADRYLLRHETADAAHYAKLHPASMSFENRMRCLNDLKALGYQVGCGFMVGSPRQTSETLASDLKFVEAFSARYVWNRPVHTAVRNALPCGKSRLSGADLLSFVNPASDPVRTCCCRPPRRSGSVHPFGREMGIQAGANVVMPNLSPQAVRKKYALYDNKVTDGDESAQCVASLAARMAAIGYEAVIDRGDVIRSD